MKIQLWVSAAMMFGLPAIAAVPAAETVADHELPPPLPPLPISHHDRPRPLGVTYFGVLDGRCSDRELPGGRRYSDNIHGLMPGQTITLKLSSPDFTPVLTIFRRAEPNSPLATVSAPADGQSVAHLFTAPDEAEYVFRVVGDDPSDEGRWQVELLYGDKLDTQSPSEAAWQEIAGHGGCAAR